MRGNAIAEERARVYAVAMDKSNHIRVPKPRRRAVRVWPSRLPSSPPRKEPPEGLLFPWLLATAGASLLLLLLTMALIKPFRILPFGCYPAVASCIALLATLSALTGCVVASVRWLLYRRNQRQNDK